MQFAVKKSDLSDPVGWVARSLPTRPPMQVLLAMKIETLDGMVSFSAFDYEQSALCKVAAEPGSKDGVVFVPGRLLSDIVKALPQDVVTVEVEGNRAVLRAGSARFTVPMIPGEDYPELPALPSNIGTVDPVELAKAISQVAIAAGKDSTLPVLTGVRVEIDPEAATLTFVATDRYRLAVRTISFTPVAGPQAMQVLIPAKSLTDFAKAMGNDEPVRLGVENGGGGSAAGFSVSNGQRTATARLLDGEFPKYAALLPSSHNGRAVVSISDLSEAVKRAGLVAHKNAPCRLTFSDGGVQVQGGTGDEAMADERVACDYEGEEMSIAFNIQYLLEGLAAVEGLEVVVSLTSGSRPATLTPVDGDGRFTYLIMPVRQA